MAQRYLYRCASLAVATFTLVSLISAVHAELPMRTTRHFLISRQTNGTASNASAPMTITQELGPADITGGRLAGVILGVIAGSAVFVLALYFAWEFFGNRLHFSSMAPAVREDFIDPKASRTTDSSAGRTPTSIPQQKHEIIPLKPRPIAEEVPWNSNEAFIGHPEQLSPKVAPRISEMPFERDDSAQKAAAAGAAALAAASAASAASARRRGNDRENTNVTIPESYWKDTDQASTLSFVADMSSPDIRARTVSHRSSRNLRAPIDDYDPAVDAEEESWEDSPVQAVFTSDRIAASNNLANIITKDTPDDIPRLAIILPSSPATPPSALFNPSSWNHSTFSLHVLCEGPKSSNEDAHMVFSPDGNDPPTYPIHEPSTFIRQAGPYLSMVATIMTSVPSLAERASRIGDSTASYRVSLGGPKSIWEASFREYMLTISEMLRDLTLSLPFVSKSPLPPRTPNSAPGTPTSRPPTAPATSHPNFPEISIRVVRESAMTQIGTLLLANGALKGQDGVMGPLRRVHIDDSHRWICEDCCKRLQYS